MMALDASTTTLELRDHLFEGSLEAEQMLLARGARGDLEALRILLDAMFIAQHNNLVPHLLSGCEILARLAASFGEASDRRRLAGVMALRAAEARSLFEHDIAEAWEAETLNLLDDLANEGHEEAAQALNDFARLFSPAAVADARATAKKALPVSLVADLAGCENLTKPNVAEAMSEAPATQPALTGEPLPSNAGQARAYFTKLRLAVGQLGRALMGKA